MTPPKEEADRKVVATVHALIPEFELVLLRAADGCQYALTPYTAGVSLESLREGQVVACVVSLPPYRVLSARVIPLNSGI
jgi:hypothetical protein